jgi:SAM-dependent methyltransferase
MPTIPRRAADSHHARDVAESFGTDAERYDRARPRYPEALIERVAAAGPGPDLLAVGSGTGIDARQFQAAGCRVLGVEADGRMAEFARGTGVETEVARFEDWDPAGRVFDVVAAGMAWHWIDPVAGAKKAAEVLRPGGRLALMWYVFDTSADLKEAFAAVYRRVLPDLPGGTMPGLAAYSAFFTKAEDGLREAGGFGAPERWRYDWSRTYTRDEYLDTVQTSGGHASLAPERLAELLTGIGDAVDAAGGRFTMEFATVAVTTTRDA